MGGSDIKIIRVALENAKFSDFRIRDGLASFLKELEIDLDDVGFELSPPGLKATEELQDIITEVETEEVKPNDTIGRSEIDESELPGVVEKDDDTDDVDDTDDDSVEHISNEDLEGY